jgi:hypothetical protein
MAIYALIAIIKKVPQLETSIFPLLKIFSADAFKITHLKEAFLDIAVTFESNRAHN